MEGPEKKVARTARDMMHDAMILSKMELVTRETCLHVVETRVLPQLRALGADVLREGVRQTNDDGMTLLHMTCCAALSFPVVRFLVEECGADPHAKTMPNDESPLHRAVASSSEHDDERDQIVDYLKKVHGADIDVRQHKDGRTELMDLCARARKPRYVYNIIRYGANVNARDNNDRGPLWYAKKHRTHVSIIIDMLLRAGADINAKNDYVLDYIYDHINDMTEATLQHALCHGYRMRPDYVTHVAPVLAKSTRPEVWRVFARYYGPYSNTMLHWAVQKQPAMVPVLMREWHNPVMRDGKGKLPRDYTTDKALIAALDEYARWTPMRVKTRWYGHYFEQRVVVFVWVCKQWRKDKVRDVPRDAMHKVIQWMA